ncbi:MAG TPA: c-type cytochrome, partial [Casimicrobiaceae bacterium]|nr:c-type cytochrome [Casimicrobiaceae bacterium]
GVGSLASDTPMRTTGSKLNHATTLFDYIRRAMPFNAPKSLTTNEVYALTAYVLNLNDILPADAVLDRRGLIAVRMPNREGFTTQHGFMRMDGRPDTHATACMTNCASDVRLLSQIPEYARDSHGDIAEQTARIRTNIAIAHVEPTEAAAGGEGMALATRSGCLACHGTDKGIVGPAFADVARRYRGDAGAAAKLVRKVQAGGAGSFGGAAMPPQNAPVADIRAIIDWILNRLQ